MCKNSCPWCPWRPGVARGRRTFDKRAAKADADNKRKLQQAMRGGMRRHGDDS